MVKCRILVPLAANPVDGQAFVFADEHHERFERRALELFGGYTFAGIARGQWRDDEGVVYSDDSRAYDIAVPSILDTARVRAFAVFAAKHYKQKAIYVEVAGIVELFTPNWRELGAAA